MISHHFDHWFTIDTDFKFSVFKILRTLSEIAFFTLAPIAFDKRETNPKTRNRVKYNEENFRPSWQNMTQAFLQYLQSLKIVCIV